MKAYNCTICNFSANLLGPKKTPKYKKHKNNIKDYEDESNEICKIYKKTLQNPRRMTNLKTLGIPKVYVGDN